MKFDVDDNDVSHDDVDNDNGVVDEMMIMMTRRTTVISYSMVECSF